MEHGGLVFGQKEEEQMELPPGFRFHPTDEELITYYLTNKIMDPGFTSRAIGDVDLNKCEPWDLPLRAKMGEKEWYFFCVKDRKYPTGLGTNRATGSGYWKATGKDKEIHRGKNLVGMKKTLVFYRGRAPKGEKSNWVMHEYRLEGKYSAYNQHKSSKNEWVICRLFHKSSGLKSKIGCFGDELGGSALLPPLMDVNYNSKNKGSPAHVTCFSNAMEGQRGHEDQLLVDYYYNNPLLSASTAAPLNMNDVSPLSLGKMPLQGNLYADPGDYGYRNMQFPGDNLVQLMENNIGYGMKQSSKTEREMLSASQETGLTSDVNPEISSVVSNNEMGKHSFDGGENPSSSAGPLQLVDCLWNY